jgi:enamine deaminase RidA (YjgF/YER057c/UK114 family)
MERIRTNLAEHGAVMDDIIKCTVFMADLSQRPALNEVYRSFFTDNRPARSAVGVDLGGPGVEIECMALLRNR